MSTSTSLAALLREPPTEEPRDFRVFDLTVREAQNSSLWSEFRCVKCTLGWSRAVTLGQVDRALASSCCELAGAGISPIGGRGTPDRSRAVSASHACGINAARSTYCR